ncbi:hypothetical protein Tco_1107922 [Tanacetum coccineum]
MKGVMKIMSLSEKKRKPISFRLILYGTSIRNEGSISRDRGPFQKPYYEAQDLEEDSVEKSSGSTTSHSDHSLLEYESFCFDVDHIEEKSSGITNSHSDISLFEYESFHFDLSIDLLSLADRSDSHLEEFADELAHIISPLEEVERFDHFFSLTQSGEKTRVMESPSVSSYHMPSPRPAAYYTTLFTPLPDSKEIFLREVERFDHFFSLTQSGEKTRVMESPSVSSYHMPSPRPAAYSPTEVMYCYYHPYLTLGDGFDHGPKMK